MSTFYDNDGRRSFTPTTTAKIYYSWFAPEGPAWFKKKARLLKPGTPVLWVVGDRERIPKSKKKEFAFADLPPHPHNKFVMISSDHPGTPSDSLPVVADWLRALKR